MYVYGLYIYIKLPHSDSYGYKNNIIHVYNDIYIYTYYCYVYKCMYIL